MLINDNHENHEDHNNHKDQNNNNHDNIILMYIYIYWLVVSTPLKNMSSSVGMIFHSQYMESHQKFHGSKLSKPPTSIYIIILYILYYIYG